MWDAGSYLPFTLFPENPEGRAEGLAEGRAEGATEERIKNAIALKRNGVSADLIAKSLDMTIEEVEALPTE